MMIVMISAIDLEGKIMWYISLYKFIIRRIRIINKINIKMIILYIVKKKLDNNNFSQMKFKEIMKEIIN